MENNRRYTDTITQELGEETKLAMDSKGLAKRAASEGTPLNQLKLRESDTGEAKDRLLEGARQELARLANFTIIEQSESGDDEKPQTVTAEQEARELTPEQAKRTLGTLQARFQDNINWNDVKASLQASPEALWSLARMESAGHSPDVYHDDETDYYFGTCSKESPESGRNCVHDKETSDFLEENAPSAQSNDGAVEMAEAMGIELMSPEHYADILQKKGRFDERTWSWLSAHSSAGAIGYAPLGRRYGDHIYTYQRYANHHSDQGAWRGSLRVKKIT